MHRTDETRRVHQIVVVFFGIWTHVFYAQSNGIQSCAQQDVTATFVHGRAFVDGPHYATADAFDVNVCVVIFISMVTLVVYASIFVVAIVRVPVIFLVVIARIIVALVVALKSKHSETHNTAFINIMVKIKY